MFVKLLSGELIPIDVESPIGALEQVAQSLNVPAFRVKLVREDESELYTAVVQDYQVDWRLLPNRVTDSRGVPHHLYRLVINENEFDVYHRGDEEYGLNNKVIVTAGDDIYIRPIQTPHTKQEIEEIAFAFLLT